MLFNFSVMKQSVVLFSFFIFLFLFKKNTHFLSIYVGLFVKDFLEEEKICLFIFPFHCVLKWSLVNYNNENNFYSIYFWSKFTLICVFVYAYIYINDTTINYSSNFFYIYIFYFLSFVAFCSSTNEVFVCLYVFSWSLIIVNYTAGNVNYSLYIDGLL